MTKVKDWNNRETTYAYDNNGRLSSITRPDGSVETYTYNAAGQLTHTIDQNGNTVINEYTYSYDADGNITDEISANEPNVNEISVDDAAMSYSEANRLTNFNGTSIPYDADGNMLKTPLGSEFGNLTFDSLNQLTDVTISGSAISCSYTYDAEGYRTSKTENGTTTNFVVDPNAELSRVLMSTTGNETTYYVYSLGLISQEKGADYRLYHYDYRGSTTAMTTSGGAVVDTMFYDAYGNMVKRTGADDTPFLYVGKYGVETDANGLYYMRARYYNPQIQRFINVDPVRDGENWYNYCNNNVICSIDAKGLDAIIITAPDGAFGFGHTSALFEQDGKWLYFYWGSERTILVDSGLTKEDVNKYKLNSVAVSYALLNNDNIKYDERYTYFVYIEGDFSGSINYYKKIEDKTKNGKNEKYSLLDRNCLQVTNELIGYGVLKNNLPISSLNIKINKPPIPNTHKHIYDSIATYSVDYNSTLYEYLPEVVNDDFYSEGYPEPMGGGGL